MENKEQEVLFNKTCDTMHECEPVAFFKERIEYLEALVRKYKFDYLTGLMGKQDFLDKFDGLFEEYKFADEDFILVLVDINNLHNINRQKGYYAGDQVIKSISEQLKSFYQFHQLFRISGDEFAILIRSYHCTQDELKSTLDKIDGITYEMDDAAGYTSPKHMFKMVDAKLSQKKTSEKRI